MARDCVRGPVYQLPALPFHFPLEARSAAWALWPGWARCRGWAAGLPRGMLMPRGKQGHHSTLPSLCFGSSPTWLQRMMENKNLLLRVL